MNNQGYYRLEDRSNHNCGELSDAETIYLSDLSEQANIPKIYIGNTPYEKVDYVKIINPTKLNVKYDSFGGNALPALNNDNIPQKQCECVLWSSSVEQKIKNWHLFIETKYVKKSMSRYKDDVVEQLLSSLNWFRENSYLDQHSVVYGLGAFPMDLSYSSSRFQNPNLEFNFDGKKMTLRKIEKEYNIKIRFSKIVEIKDDENLNFNIRSMNRI